MRILDPGGSFETIKRRQTLSKPVLLPQGSRRHLKVIPLSALVIRISSFLPRSALSLTPYWSALNIYYELHTSERGYQWRQWPVKWKNDLSTDYRNETEYQRRRSLCKSFSHESDQGRVKTATIIKMSIEYSREITQNKEMLIECHYQLPKYPTSFPGCTVACPMWHVPDSPLPGQTTTCS